MRSRTTTKTFMVMGTVGLAFIFAGCGGGFSSACKVAINQGIDLGIKTEQLSSVTGAACADTSSSAALEQACQELQTNTDSLSIICGDSYGDALKAGILGERQY